MTRGISGILLIVQHRMVGKAAALVTSVRDNFPEPPQYQEAAFSLDIRMAQADLLRCADVFELCEEATRRGLRPCTIRAGRHIFPRPHPIGVHDGLAIVVNVPSLQRAEAWDTFLRNQDADDEEADDEETVMMARRPRIRPAQPSTSSSSTSSTSPALRSYLDSLRPTVAFSLDGTSSSLLLSADTPAQALEVIAVSMNIDPSELSQFFLVEEVPQDLQQLGLQCLLLQRRVDPRPHHFLRLALLDVDITEQSDVLPGTIQRRASWLPHVTTVLSLFRLWNIERYFLDHTELCHLWHNNVEVDIARSSPIHIEDGDYVRIFIGQHPDSCMEEANLAEEESNCTDDPSLLQLSSSRFIHQLKRTDQQDMAVALQDLCLPVPAPRNCGGSFARS